ncbi:hypothetical protein Mapa_014275 [Marchantia paleacea]|nr:hypothetical protein Mapa_014275 [Marchantia paleacea]
MVYPEGFCSICCQMCTDLQILCLLHCEHQRALRAPVFYRFKTRDLSVTQTKRREKKDKKKNAWHLVNHYYRTT